MMAGIMGVNTSWGFEIQNLAMVGIYDTIIKDFKTNLPFFG